MEGLVVIRKLEIFFKTRSIPIFIPHLLSNQKTQQRNYFPFPMAEIFLGAVVSVLVEKLASSDFINLPRSARILSELPKWRNTLVQIQAVLVDAGQKQIRDTSVQVWLRDLQRLAYDIDNVLDDLSTEALRRQLNDGSDHASTSSNKKRKIFQTWFASFTTPRTLVYGHDMSSKLDEITTRLLELVDQKKLLGLTDKVERSVGIYRKVEQTSLVDESSSFVGREGDKEALLRLLKEPCDENVSVVSIVGMGGIGKTTLANVVYKELKKVKDLFELNAWVCVSDDFNIFNISKAIYKDVSGEDKSYENLNALHQALSEKLSKKRFLVFLDDVWNESYEKWEVFRRPFGVGAPGSKIMVTTRNVKVASVMDCVQPYHLKTLSNEEALSLFAQHALGKPNFDSHSEYRLHGEGIISKCDGLPLALRTLGRMLRRKTDVKEWEELLNSEIWSLQDESDNILPALRLSYYDLPPHLKQMFAYCSLFPKDYIFDKDELVLLWMAEGFLNPTNGRKSMECLGREYFEELKSRSFFQPSTNDKSQYTMHDVINDLATSVAGEFFFRANDGLWIEAMDKFHHFSFICEEYGQYRKLNALRTASRLRTFLALPVNANFSSGLSMRKVIVELLPHLQFLRVLILTGSLIKEVPQSIGSLKHIRYLNFSKTSISCLPDQVSDLYNLQSLLVKGCIQLSSLPHSFEKLINLRHLDISDTPRLKKLPLGIGGLTSLQTLSKVIIEEADGFKISELKGLSDLHGRLFIMELHKVKSVMHAQEAKLHQKEGLDDLELEWNDAFYGSQDEITAYKVLEGLRPHDKLRKLKISFYNGTRFPYWVGDPTFDQLTKLTLSGCRSCTRLPTLGQLGSLRSLYVEDISGVKTLDSEFLGPANSCQGIAFPSLEVLDFLDMQDWERWTTNGCHNNGTVGSFPCLRNISIRFCPKLAEVSIGLIPSLEDLRVQRCTELVLQNMVGVSSSISRLEIESIEGLTHLHGEVIKHLGAVEYLRIGSCNEVRYLWESESEACKILVNLRELNVNSCEKLLAVGGKEVNLGVCLKSVREVFVQDCMRLESYNCPNGIENLMFGNCSLTSLTFELPSTLKSLHLSLCYNLQESCFHNNFLSSLESLSIFVWSNLRSFREGCFAHLTNLTIAGCDNIESIPENGFGFLPHLCLRYLCIHGCKNLKSFPHQHLQKLTSLKKMQIYNCPSMNESFPCGSWPPNLSRLSIGNLKKPMSEWGSQNFPTSLATLELFGENSGVVSFAKEDVMNNNNTFILPPSLTSLEINDFLDLKSLSVGLQHLTSLERLHIESCPKLRDLPKTLLPLLSSLRVLSCHELEKRCRDRKGDYWPIISEICYVVIGYSTTSDDTW